MSQIITKLPKDPYLSVVQNSIGTKMFQNLPVLKNGEVFDAVEGGVLSCAFFVSGILSMLGLIESVHATVVSTQKDLMENGWKTTNNPIESGDVIIWAINESGHEHIGFALDSTGAISNSETHKTPMQHAIDKNNRSVLAVWRRRWE